MSLITSYRRAIVPETADETLVAAALDGDGKALDSLLRRHHDRVHALCRRLAGNDADAADATQEALITIVRRLDRFDGRSKFTTWMYTVARRTTLNFLRDEKEEGDKVPVLPGEENADGSPALQLPGPDDLNPETMAWSAEIQERVRKFFDAKLKGE